MSYLDYHLLEGPYMTTTITTDNAEYINALESVVRAYTQVTQTWDDKVLPAGEYAASKILGHRFSTVDVLDNYVGYRNAENGTHLVFGDWQPIGNVEGSLYFLSGFNENTHKFTSNLRVRWGQTISFRGTQLNLNYGELSIAILDGKRVQTKLDGSLNFANYSGDEIAFTPVTDLEPILSTLGKIGENLTAANTALEEVVATAEPVKQ